MYLDAGPVHLRSLKALLAARDAGMVVFVEPGHRNEEFLREQAELVVTADPSVDHSADPSADTGEEATPTRTYALDEAIVLAVVFATQPARSSDVSTAILRVQHRGGGYCVDVAYSEGPEGDGGCSHVPPPPKRDVRVSVCVCCRWSVCPARP